MQFPVYVGVGPLAVHPHPLFEGLGYVVAAYLFKWLRARQGDALDEDTRGWVVVAAVVGGAIGSKLMYLASDPEVTFGGGFGVLLGGKSIVGGLVGALIGVELAKWWLGVTRSTGDLFAVPCALGIAVGRIGCFLTGLSDHTHGLPTSLPWGVDFGDGLPRHPTQLYEIVFLCLLAVVLYRWRPRREGDTFRLFLAAYAAFRLWVELIKPGVLYGWLNGIQWVCLAVLIYYAAQVAPRARVAHG
jgi:prolipoprotein diacylglyceryltransferase